jgi:hypothetical protein
MADNKELVQDGQKQRELGPVKSFLKEIPNSL